jgi:hypothetical protein
MSVRLPVQLVHLNRRHLHVAHSSVSGGRACELAMMTRVHVVSGVWLVSIGDLLYCLTLY